MEANERHFHVGDVGVERERAIQDPGFPGLFLDRDFGKGPRLPWLQHYRAERFEGDELLRLGRNADLVHHDRHRELIGYADIPAESG